MSCERPTTSLCRCTPDDILVRGRSLPRDIIGKMSFTEMIYFHFTGRDPTPAQTAVLDACLVALMEHGLTPTAVSARLTYGSAPEAMQGAVAAGLLSVGSLSAGTVEGCAAILTRMVSATSPRDVARAIARTARSTGQRLPGFGHAAQDLFDPRSAALLEIARRHGIYGGHCAALEWLADMLTEESGQTVPIDATGAVAAVLADADLPIAILRGIALISRCAGLVGHIREEQEQPASSALWRGAEAAVPYAPSPEEER